MGLIDLALPGSVLLLKAISKLFIEQEVRAVDLFRAALSFPTDIAFLSFSFGAAVLYGLDPSGQARVGGQMLVLFAVLCTTILLLVTALTKKSDRSFTADRNGECLMFAAVSYVGSFTVLGFVLYLGMVLP